MEDWLSRKCKKSLRKLRAIYRTEREVLNLILNLKDVSSELMHSFADWRPNFDLESVAVNTGTVKELLVAFHRSLNSVLEDPNVVCASALCSMFCLFLNPVKMNIDGDVNCTESSAEDCNLPSPQKGGEEAGTESKKRIARAT